MRSKTTKKKTVPRGINKAAKAVLTAATGNILIASEKSFTKNEIIQELIRSPHGDLTTYVPVGLKAAVTEPEFFAHLIAWNRIKGEIRDSKVALPVIQLSAGKTAGEFSDNALAHMAMLDPRNFVRSLRFSKAIKTPGFSRKIREMVEAYLRTKEKNWAKWERLALQHRTSMKELYALFHVKPNAMADDILFKGRYPKGTVFEIVANLKNMNPSEAAGFIIDCKIPFLIAAGALGAKFKEPDVLMAMIGRMSPTELVTNMKRLEKLGVKNHPACRAALEEALKKASESKKNTLKTTVAVEQLEDEGLREKLKVLQEKQMDNRVKTQGVEGDWLVAGDASGSMHTAIETARHTAAVLTKMVKGKVHLIFFNESPRYIDGTGKSYEELLDITKHVKADGGTHIGCTLQYVLDRNIQIHGIVLISDGGENRFPVFSDRYVAYKQKFGTEPTVYFYHTDGDSDRWSENMKYAKVPFETFDLRGKQMDYYSLPGLVSTMRTNRYSLIDEILGTRLVKLEDVLEVA